MGKGEIRVRFALSTSRTHSLYSEIIEAPPEGVSFITDEPEKEPTPGSKSRSGGLGVRLRRSPTVRAFADRVLVRGLPTDDGSIQWLSTRLGCAMVRLAGGKAGVDKSAEQFDVFHSPGASMVENIPWIVANDVRWVVDFEHVGSLFGYYGDWKGRTLNASRKKVLAKQLESRYCRKLLPWSEASRRTVGIMFPQKEVMDKTEVLRLAIRPAPPRSSDIPKHDAVRILFIGSSNFKGEFWSKGGYEVLESYKRLRDKLGDSVELVFRCWMPDEMRDRYASVPGLHSITDVLPRDAFDRLFWESDIFLFPAHNTPGMAFLEAMRFGLPIVGKSVWGNSEIVEDGVSGYLVDPSEKVPYYVSGSVPNWGGDDSPFLQYMRIHDERVINDLVDRLTLLVESENLRKSMGEAGRRAVEDGHASISKRNEQLRKIYEEAAKN